METDIGKLRRDIRRYRFLLATLDDPLGLLILDGLMDEARENLRTIGDEAKAARRPAAEAPRH
jgi:hypothetical protein